VNKPYYAIEFSAAACIAEIRVNDIPVLYMEFPGQASSLTPVNFAIPETGSQLLTARILPLAGHTTVEQNAKLSYELRLYEIVNGFELKETVLDYTFPAIEPDKKVQALDKTHQFHAEVPYNFMGWRNGQNLTKIDDAFPKLVNAYKKAAAMIKNKEYASYATAIANREHIMTTSMYLSEQKAAARINSLIKDFESGFILAPFPDDAVLRIYAGGKMAALMRPNTDHILRVVNEEKDEEVLLDLAFYMPLNKTEFEII
jgi:hypothetical protein